MHTAISHKARTAINLFMTVLSLSLLGLGAASSPATETLVLKGVSQPVEIIRDPWGISHIYAQNQKDLFFAQGFNVARDRLFQLEIWRRLATGTLAEILGRKALERDIGSRLLKLRADMKAEMAQYHSQGEEIIESFVQGVNACVEIMEKNPAELPVEFRLLGIKPGRWTPEVVVSRHNGLYRNAGQEVELARLIAVLGKEKARPLLDLHPGDPDLTAPAGLDPSLIPEGVLGPYRSSFRITSEDIVDAASRAERTSGPGIGASGDPGFGSGLAEEGSNNWVVAGKRTLSGHPFMANDPHRVIQVPSLRYWVHLVAPGWNVIGGGEPAVPGVAVGHNDHGAWGLTIFPIDQEDLYAYETQDGRPSWYRYKGTWEQMRVIQETIPVRGEAPVLVDLKYTRHGPVLYEDLAKRKAYALKAAWLEIGASPYLASLRIDQARTWQEFRQACSYWRIPSLNMLWAGVDGNIGWQVVGIAPVRKGWNGLLPVPGDGRFEWEGYLPALDLPHVLNPAEEHFASANQDNVPPGYAHSLGFSWAEPFRFGRIQEVLRSGRQFTLTDMMTLQHDEVSLPARSLVPLLRGLKSSDAKAQEALEMLLRWDYRLDSDSIPAATYVAWERVLDEEVWNLYVPENARRILRTRSLKKMIDWLTVPDGHFGPDPVAGRDKLLLSCLEKAVQRLVRELGPDMAQWRYGQQRLHHVLIRHPLSDAVNPQIRSKLDIGPAPRGGNAQTVNNTGGSHNQSSGASFRIIADLSDWNHSIGTNTPGQSGDPDSVHYRDLFDLWARGKYFPAYFSRAKVQPAAREITILKPVSGTQR